MEKSNKNYIIAIDGCAATGKSVLAKGIAQKLNILYIDTGAMYRAAGVYFLEKGLELTEENIKRNIDSIDIRLAYEDNMTKVFLNNKDVTDKIRTSKASMAASDVSKFLPVREKLVELQRKMAENSNVVLEGRDIGTVVFPNATLKIFLSATADIRAIRRQRDLAKKGEIKDIDIIREELLKRDLQDSTRKESPLRKAEDAIEIDTTSLTNDETVDMVIELLKERVELS
ncbi:MAG: (d)CMP kinase [Clostridia bacterium]|nr:(d)CMP kinase [Clostridia bacterium]